jgi:glyoxylase-like metal-dependent hydrolase (beta-lactamase superfamily II)
VPLPDRLTIGVFATALAALFLLPAPTFAQAPPTAPDAPPFALKQIGPGVYAAIGGPRAGSNAGFVVGDDGVLVIDTFFYPEAAKALLEQIRQITPKPVRYVINTHYHVDHVAGDAVFKAAGATIIAHRNVPGWIHSENLHLLGNDLTPELKQRVETLIPPDRTIDKPLKLLLGRRRIEVRPILGHTGGDLMVEVPDSKVVFAGDIFWNHRTPTITDGTISLWSDSLARLEASQDTVFVPGHGDIASKKEVEDLRRFFCDLERLTAEGRRAGLTGDALISAEGPKFRALHEDWTYMDRAPGILIPQMEAELAGNKRVPKPADGVRQTR